MSEPVRDGLSNILTAKKPLIICDVDEVVLKFVEPFEHFLKARNLILLKTSFRLGGNIINLENKAAISNEETSNLVRNFHESHVDEQPFIADAPRVLKKLATHFQIVFLTNVAPDLAERRTRHLHQAGLLFPVVQNNGSKAAAAQKIRHQTQSTAIFLDDLPAHHHAIKAAMPDIHCIHFMADETLRALVDLPDTIAQRAESWQDIERLCLGAL